MGLMEIVFEFGEARGNTAEGLGRDAGFELKKFEAVGDGAERAATFARDLWNGQLFDAVKVEHGIKGRGLAAGVLVVGLERQESAAGNFFVGRRRAERGDLGKELFGRSGADQGARFIARFFRRASSLRRARLAASRWVRIASQIRGRFGISKCKAKPATRWLTGPVRRPG